VQKVHILRLPDLADAANRDLPRKRGICRKARGLPRYRHRCPG